MASLDYIELPAVDLDATKAFYCSAFGWEWTDYGASYSTAEQITPEVALSADASPSPRHEPGGQSAIGPLILLSSTDLEASLAIVTEAGATIVSPPYAYPGGRRFHFADPSGNILGIYQADEPSDAS